MRHKVAGKRLDRHQGARNALRRTLIVQLFENERIRTTRAKAEAIRPGAEKLITLAKRANASEESDKVVYARRLVAARLGDPDPEVVRILFDEIAPRFADRNGGYTRMFKLGPRSSDKAQMVLLELVE